MTTHEQPEVMRQIEGAAGRYALGQHRKMYLPVQIGNTRLTVIGVIAVTSGVLLAYSLATGFIPGLIGGGIFFAMFGLNFLSFLMGRWETHGARLDLYDNGFVVYRSRRVRTVRYDTTSVKAMITRHTGAQQNHTSYNLTFTDVDGAKFLLHQGFHNAAEWSATMQESVARAQLPKAVAEIQRGGSVEFGRVTVSAQALSTKKRTVPWSEVARLDIRDGNVYIDDARGRTIEVLMVSDTPNFYVFHTIVQQLRGTQPASP